MPRIFNSIALLLVGVLLSLVSLGLCGFFTFDCDLFSDQYQEALQQLPSTQQVVVSTLRASLDACTYSRSWLALTVVCLALVGALMALIIVQNLFTEKMSSRNQTVFAFALTFVSWSLVLCSFFSWLCVVVTYIVCPSATSVVERIAVPALTSEAVIFWLVGALYEARTAHTPTPPASKDLGIHNTF